MYVYKAPTEEHKNKTKQTTNDKRQKLENHFKIMWYNQTNEFVYLGRNVNPQCRPVHRGRPAHTQRMVQLAEVHPRTVRPTERSPRAQNPDAIRAEVLETMLYGCVTWSPRACHYDTTLRRAHHRLLTRCIGWLVKAQSRRPTDFLPGHACQDGK